MEKSRVAWFFARRIEKTPLSIAFSFVQQNQSVKKPDKDVSRGAHDWIPAAPQGHAARKNL